MYNIEHKFIFTHPPKCGGGSIKLLLNQLKSSVVIPGHKDLNFYKRILGDEQFNNFFKFACVRNPFDRMVSSYYFNRHLPERIIRRNKRLNSNVIVFTKPSKLQRYFLTCTFDEYVEAIYTIHRKNLSIVGNPHELKKFVSLNNEYILDDIVRYENYVSDVQRVLNHLGIEVNSKDIPRRNKTPREVEDYRYYYKNKKTRRMTEELCKFTIEQFGYSF